jgi:hypothetical protein
MTQAPHTLAQETLLDFLIADLDVCFMMLNTDFKISDSKQYQSALENAYKELQMIRTLTGRIEDRESWKIQ